MSRWALFIEGAGAVVGGGELILEVFETQAEARQELEFRGGRVCSDWEIRDVRELDDDEEV